jgi:hypothetical protein
LPSASEPPDPVFVGGYRSGTTIIGMLIGAHSAYAEVPELKFHTDRGGLIDLIEGRTTLDRFLEKLDVCYRRSPPAERPAGLHDLVPRDRFAAIAEAFASSFPQSPGGAGRALILDVIQPRLESTGKPGWVEATPTTTAAAAGLHALVPEARFVHMLRDGRESVVSARRMGWISSDLEREIHWWEARVRRADEQCRALPPGRFLAIELVDLVRDRRDHTYQTLLDFLNLDDEPALRTFFDIEVVVEGTRIEDWREDLAPDELDRLDAAYAEAIDGLRRDGVSLLPRTAPVP